MSRQVHSKLSQPTKLNIPKPYPIKKSTNKTNYQSQGDLNSYTNTNTHQHSSSLTNLSHSLNRSYSKLNAIDKPELFPTIQKQRSFKLNKTSQKQRRLEKIYNNYMPPDSSNSQSFITIRNPQLSSEQVILAQSNQLSNSTNDLSQLKESFQRASQKFQKLISKDSKDFQIPKFENNQDFFTNLRPNPSSVTTLDRFEQSGSQSFSKRKDSEEQIRQSQEQVIERREEVKPQEFKIRTVSSRRAQSPYQGLQQNINTSEAPQAQQYELQNMSFQEEQKSSIEERKQQPVSQNQEVTLDYLALTTDHQRNQSAASQISRVNNHSSDNQQNKVNEVIDRVKNFLQRRVEQGNFKINVNQLETALSDAIGLDEGQNLTKNSLSSFNNKQETNHDHSNYEDILREINQNNFYKRQNSQQEQSNKTLIHGPGASPLARKAQFRNKIGSLSSSKLQLKLNRVSPSAFHSNISEDREYREIIIQSPLKNFKLEKRITETDSFDEEGTEQQNFFVIASPRKKERDGDILALIQEAHETINQIKEQHSSLVKDDYSISNQSYDISNDSNQLNLNIKKFKYQDNKDQIYKNIFEKQIQQDLIDEDYLENKQKSERLLAKDVILRQDGVDQFEIFIGSKNSISKEFVKRVREKNILNRNTFVLNHHSQTTGQVHQFVKDDICDEIIKPSEDDEFERQISDYQEFFDDSLRQGDDEPDLDTLVLDRKPSIPKKERKRRQTQYLENIINYKSNTLGPEGFFSPLRLQGMNSIGKKDFSQIMRSNHSTQRSAGGRNKHELNQSFVNYENLSTFEDDMIYQFKKGKELQKQQTLKQEFEISDNIKSKLGVGYEINSLDKNIYDIYWSQRMGKIYFIFPKAEILDKLANFEIDERKLEKGLNEFNLDIDLNVGQLDEFDTHKIWEEFQNQFDNMLVCFQVILKVKKLILQPSIMLLFGELLNHVYTSRSELRHIFQYKRKGRVSKEVMTIVNDELWNSRYQSLAQYFEKKSKYQQNLREKEKLIESRVGRVCNKFGVAQKSEFLEIHNVVVQDFILKKEVIKASEIVKIVFQSRKKMIQNYLYDDDQDYELVLNLDKMLKQMRKKFYGTTKIRVKKKNPLENIVKVQRKYVLRKKKSQFETAKKIEKSSGNNTILNSEFSKKLLNVMVYKKSNPVYQVQNLTESMKMQLLKKQKNSWNDNGIYSALKQLKRKKGASTSFTKLGNIIIKEGKKKETEQSDVSDVQEEEIIKQFGYKCLMVRDPSGLFMFEIFEPTPLETLKEMFRRGLQRTIKLFNEEKDEFKTDSSMRDWSDNQDEYDKNIQKQFVQKFILKQKKTTFSFINNILDDAQKSNVKKFRHENYNFTPMREYYKKLTKKKKEINHNESMDLAEVVSGEEMQENDEENFYIQMQNNIQIKQVINEIGGNQRSTINRRTSTMNLLRKDDNSCMLDTDSDQVRGSSLEIETSHSSLDRLHSRKIKKLEVLTRQNSIRKMKKHRTLDKRRGHSHSSHIHVENQNDTQQQVKTVYMQEQNEIQNLLLETVLNQKEAHLKYLLDRFHLSLDHLRDQQDNTLLIMATKLGTNEIVKLLLEHGADPDIQNNEGNVALHYAISLGYTRIINLLLYYAADESVQNYNGHTPWECQV